MNTAAIIQILSSDHPDKHGQKGNYKMLCSIVFCFSMCVYILLCPIDQSTEGKVLLLEVSTVPTPRVKADGWPFLATAFEPFVTVFTCVRAVCSQSAMCLRAVILLNIK